MTKIRESGPKTKTSDVSGKDPSAVALGRRGGLKGGVARAKKLTARRRSEIAKLAANFRWAKDQKGGSNMASRWRKKLTKSDAQEDTNGARMPFLRFTKGNIGGDHTTWFRDEFFGGLGWAPAGGTKEEASVKVHVTLAGDDLGIRTMRLDHDPARASNHRAPTTHLHYDSKTRQALEAARLSGRPVVVERDDAGNYSLTVA